MIGLVMLGCGRVPVGAPGFWSTGLVMSMGPKTVSSFEEVIAARMVSLLSGSVARVRTSTAQLILAWPPMAPVHWLSVACS